MQQVVDALTERGMEAGTIEDGGVVAVEVPCDDDGNRDCAEVLAEIETWLVEEGLPFVPEEVDGRVLIRPPAG
jgi:hypothetical protein